MHGVWWSKRVLATGVAGLLLISACSSGDGSSSDSPGDEAASSEDAPTCDQGATVDQVEAVPVDGTPSDYTITSFDDTQIRAHWFPAPDASESEPVPTVLMGPGWGQAGDTNAAVSDDPGNPITASVLSIGNLNQQGYNVLTWDPRGFGQSTGTVTVDDPEHEGRDVQVLMDWLADQPEVQIDREGDPRVGMVGGSYGGGIQLAVASIDCRVDALVPNVAWHSLVTSLYKNETPKEGWGRLLNAISGPNADPHIVEAAEAGLNGGLLDEESVEWFAARGPGDRVEEITAPTLIVHGTADTLFTPTEAVTNFEALQEAGTTVSMVWYCGGHGVCLTDPGDPAVTGQRSLAWLDRYLKDDEGADLGPVVDVIDQNGERWVGDDYPEEFEMVTADGGSGMLELSETSKAGPADVAGSSDILATVAGGITPARAEQAVELTLESEADTLALGSPHVTMTYSGTAPDGNEPTRAFAQLVDEETGVVLGNQITPIELELDGEEHTVEVDLEVIAHHLTEGSSVTLQIVATTPAYAVPRLGGSLDITDLTLDLPTTDTLSAG